MMNKSEEIKSKIESLSEAQKGELLTWMFFRTGLDYSEMEKLLELAELTTEEVSPYGEEPHPVEKEAIEIMANINKHQP